MSVLATEEEWDRLEARLLWLYGPARAHAKLYGEDPETERDLAAWRNLGKREQAA